MKPISIIIPVYNEQESIVDLIYELNNELQNKLIYEIIIVNDGSTDSTYEYLSKIKNINFKIINNSENFGQSKSIHNGIANSKYDSIVTLDGDGQNIPGDIIKICRKFFESSEIKLVSGIRVNRKDNIIKRTSSKIANMIRNLILNDKCTDTGCSLKIFDKKIFLSFYFFDGIHRFIPAFFVRNNYKVLYVNVGHRHRLKGESKYGTKDRLTKGIIDLIKVRKILNKND